MKIAFSRSDLVNAIFTAPKTFFSSAEGALAHKIQDTNDLPTNCFRGIPLVLFCVFGAMLTVLCVFGCVLTGLFVEELGPDLFPVSGSGRFHTENRTRIGNVLRLSTDASQKGSPQEPGSSFETSYICSRFPLCFQRFADREVRKTFLAFGHALPPQRKKWDVDGLATAPSQ